MKFTLNEIRKKAHTHPFTFDQELNVSHIRSRHQDIRDINPVQVKGHCVIDGDQFIFSLNIKGQMVLPCARTLVDVPHSFDIHETEIFSLAEELESRLVDNDDDDDDIHVIEGHVIDLMPFIEEHILLNVPFRVFSTDEEVLKNAPLKGDGWELLEEAPEKEAQEDAIDPRLKKLQSLLDEKNKETDD